MQKIVKSLVTITAVAAIAVGATGAYFSSSASSEGNTFAAGTMTIMLADNDETTPSSSVSATFGEDNLYPGQVLPQQVLDVINTGSLNGNHLDMEVTLSGNADLAKYIDFSYNGSTNPNALRFGANTAGNQSVSLDRDWYPAGDSEYWLANGSTGANMNMDRDDDGKVTLWDLSLMKTRIVPGTINAGVASGTTAHLWMNANVDPAMGNDMQGQTVTATFSWTLHQDASQM